MFSAYRLSSAASVLAVAMLATPAFANDTATADVTAASADAAAAPAGETAGLTDIVVTATKRETNLQKTPIAISVMGVVVSALSVTGVVIWYRKRFARRRSARAGRPA